MKTVIAAMLLLATGALAQNSRAPRRVVASILQQQSDSVQIEAAWTPPTRGLRYVTGYAVRATSLAWAVVDTVPAVQLTDSLWLRQDTVALDARVCVVAFGVGVSSDAACSTITIPALAVLIDAPGTPQVTVLEPAPPPAWTATLSAVATWDGGEFPLRVTLTNASSGAPLASVSVTTELLVGQWGSGTSETRTRTTDASGNVFPGNLHTGTRARITAPGAEPVEIAVDTAATPPPPPPTNPPPSGANLTPANLMPILGPIVARPATQTGAIAVYDQRFASTEQQRFVDWLAFENDPGGAYLLGNHYGGLRSRLMWSIRNGLPFGAGVVDESKYPYARGRRILLRYLQYSKTNGYSAQPHNNTGMPDLEALYRLEGNVDALTHIHVIAIFATRDPWGYYKMQNPNSDARGISVALQAFMAADRLGIPYANNPANNQAFVDPALGSWRVAVQRQVDWLTQYDVVKADGSIPSPGHGGAEAYLFNAMLATELLHWYATTGDTAGSLALARRIIDHLIAVLPAGWSCLGYLSTSPAAAPDLAAFYIWPSLVLWQATGLAVYRSFAEQHLAAANGAYIAGIKQWNQTFSTLGQGVEALLAGQSWK